jgi:hypothetical protein
MCFTRVEVILLMILCTFVIYYNPGRFEPNSTVPFPQDGGAYHPYFKVAKYPFATQESHHKPDVRHHDREETRHVKSQTVAEEPTLMETDSNEFHSDHNFGIEWVLVVLGLLFLGTTLFLLLIGACGFWSLRLLISGLDGSACRRVVEQPPHNHLGVFRGHSFAKEFNLTSRHLNLQEFNMWYSGLVSNNLLNSTVVQLISDESSNVIPQTTIVQERNVDVVNIQFDQCNYQYIILLMEWSRRVLPQLNNSFCCQSKDQPGSPPNQSTLTEEEEKEISQQDHRQTVENPEIIENVDNVEIANNPVVLNPNIAPNLASNTFATIDSDYAAPVMNDAKDRVQCWLNVDAFNDWVLNEKTPSPPLSTILRVPLESPPTVVPVGNEEEYAQLLNYWCVQVMQLGLAFDSATPESL